MPEPVTCLDCGAVDPPPEMTCDGGRPGATLWRDHYVGTERGCPSCGRLVLACARRPCQEFSAARDAAGDGGDL